MQESEQALSDAAESESEGAARIARHVLSDQKIHRVWEARHAELVLPVAGNSRRTRQVRELRRIEVQLIHRRALVDYIRRKKLTGSARTRLFRQFYGPKDNIDAILVEHRQYMLAVSSHVSADRLIDIIRDPVGRQLLDLYERAYRNYFELYCYVSCTKDPSIAAVTRPTVVEYRERAARIRKRLEAAPATTPEDKFGFDRQAMLARSGRYPMSNYLLS